MSLSKRLESVQRLLSSKDMDFLLIDDPDSLFYLTNLQLSAGLMLITQKNANLFVDGRYIATARENSPFQVDLLSQEALSETICTYGSNLSKKIGFNSSKTSYCSYLKFNDFIERIKQQRKVVDFKLVAIENPLKPFRLIKDATEIQKMKKAANLTWKAFEHICSFLTEGVKETEVAVEFEVFCRKNGADSMAFSPIIAFGENTAYPHHKSSKRALKANDAVLIDIGIVLDHYCSDMTRMIFVGKPDPAIEKYYSVVKKAHQKALSLCKPGVKLGDLDRVAREVMAEEKIEELFLHSLGHGIGIEVHEYPRIKWDGEDKDLILKPGMVFTIEPGLYKEKIGGARYEDMILITQDGYENFYSSI
ncbi:MAG: Xaa-Pro peptidase family protein [Chlamydiota bacterium]|jgi:Xaa-Pro aminopeptidase